MELLDVFGAPDACVAHLLCDRHDPSSTAFTVVGENGSVHRLTYAELGDGSRRFAAVLADLGVGPGDRVATLMGKSADLAVALMGIWRRGAVHVPLFTAFAADSVTYRLDASAAAVVVVDAAHLPKLDAAAPWRVLSVGAAAGPDRFEDLLAAADPTDPRAAAAAVGGGAEFARLFTSGTTGAPKGVPITVRALASFVAYFEFGLGVEPDDVFWDAADPGWGYGLYYGIMAPLAAGQPNILLRAGFTPELTYRVMRELGVTNFAAAPTVFRVLRGAAVPPPDGLALRRCSSAGEPLTPEVIDWAERRLGVAVHDTYGQTEHGMCIANSWHPLVARPLRDGSMGQSMPGWSMEVLRPDADVPAAPDEHGRVAVDVTGSPLLWFTGYVDAPDKTAERFSPDGRWYYTGDAGRRDADGYFYFTARDDDVIIMAGYRIGPIEVETVLLTHPLVTAAAVVGVPDPLRGEVLEAFVVLREDAVPADDLTEQLQQLVKKRYAAHAYPRAVHVRTSLPMTESGKVKRSVLRLQRHAEQGSTPSTDHGSHP